MMITIKDVLKAINQRLKQAFPNVPIQSTDVKEGYKRPCFYSSITDFKTEQLMTAYDRKNAVISILFFPSDATSHQLEILDIRERLQGAFIGTLNITDDFIIHILEIEDEVSDGVLNIDIEIEYYTRRAEPTGVLIENIEIENI